ncbi:MAG: SDH family Clp fold serine proteinase [Chloroflexota bacterium]|jgi:ClpP class serine protease|uniref:Serine protease n=1 Tax=Bellilinea caldifistulae TaxID=360411 RepID=A0A7C4KXP5_9CHLR|nr:ATP-dependent Clp protease proteolytic subunit [Bellilinea sp.]
MDLINLLWLFLIISSLVPLFRQKIIEADRLRLMRTIETKRGSRVIALIHRQESMSFLGFPVARYIDIQDSEQVLRAIKLTDPKLPIDIILHTPGGLVLAAEQIANALARHEGKVTVMVPHYAMSGGTMIALAADEILMDENAVLGPVDPQIGNFPAASILQVVAEKDRNRIDDETLILADISRKAIEQVKATIRRIASANYPVEKAEFLAEELATGKWTHDYPITVDEARQLGLNVKTELPEEIYQLMNLYPQTQQRRPSVEYIPLPYPARPALPARKTKSE